MAAGDVEGARVVIDAGDGGVWLSCFVVRRLSWLVAAKDVRGGGCYEWATWRRAVVEVVVVG